MADSEKNINISINADASSAEQTYNGLANKIKKPVEMTIGADVKDAVAAIKELQKMFKALTNQGKEGQKLRINIAGIGNVQKQLEQIDATLSTLSEHFTGLRRSVDIQGEINDNRRALEAYKSSFSDVAAQVNKVRITRDTDSFFNMKKTKNNIEDIINGASFKQVYEDSKSNVSRLLIEIAKAAQEADGLSRAIQISEDQSFTLGDIFDKITTSIQESGKSLSDLGINGLNASIIESIGNIQKLESETSSLQEKFNEAVNREKSGSINVQIDADSIQRLSDTISELKGVFKLDEDSIIGFKPEQIDAITNSFKDLQSILENIQSLLSHFDIPLKDIPTSIKDKLDSDQPEAGSGVVSSVEKVGDASDEAATDVRELNNELGNLGDGGGAASAASQIENIGTSAGEAVEKVKELKNEMEGLSEAGESSGKYKSKTDDEIYSSAMELAKNRESILKDIGQREIDMANKMQGEAREAYQKMALDTYNLFKNGKQDGDYDIDDKLLQVKQHMQNLQEQISEESNPEILSLLNEQLDEAKIKLIALSEVFKESASRAGVYETDALSFGSEAIDRYSRSQRENYKIGDSNFSIAKDDKEYWDTLTNGIKTEQDLTDAIEKRKQALADLEEKRSAAEEKTLSLDRQSPEYQTAFNEEMDITDQYNDARQELYNLIQLQQNWGKSLQEASQIDISFLSTEWRQEEQVFNEIDDAIKKIIQDRVELKEVETTPSESSIKQDNRTLEEKLELLKNIKSEYKFMETADEKKIDMEEKAWDVGGNNPKSDADAQKKIDKYEDLCEHIEKANDALNEFETNYSKAIISLKNGEKIEITDFANDLENTSLDKRRIKDIQLIPNLEDASLNDLVSFLSELKSSASSSEDVIHEVTSAISELLGLDPSKFESFTDILARLNDDTDGAANVQQTVDALEKLSKEKAKLPFGRQTAEDLREIDDWIDANTNRQIYPPVAYADSVEEIEGVIKKVTEFRDRLVEIQRNDAFSTLSQGMQRDVGDSIIWLNNLINTENRLMKTQGQFDAQNKIYDQARDEIEQTKRLIDGFKSDIPELDPDGLLSKYLLGENGIKSGEQLAKEINSEFDAISKSLYEEYLKGDIKTDDDYVKAFENTFRKLNAAQSFGLIGYNLDKDDPLQKLQGLYDRWIKISRNDENSWYSMKDGLSDEVYSAIGGLCDAQERLNVLQRNGGEDYIDYLTKAKSLSEEVQQARERNATFQKTDIETTQMTQEDANSRAEALLAEKAALDQLIASVEEFKSANKDMVDASSYFGNYLPNTSGLKTMSDMMEDEIDNLQLLTHKRNRAQEKIYEEAVDHMFGRGSQAPKELERYFEQLYDSFSPSQGLAPFSGEEAIEKLNQKAKELGVTFDETQKKWVQLSSTIASEKPASSDVGQQMGEQITESIDETTKSVNSYREALNKSFDTMNKRDATSQLRDAFNEYQKYFGENGSEADKITRELSDEARIAAYNYSEAYKEALKKEISETNLSRYRISDFGKYTTAKDVDDVFSDEREYMQEQARILEELGNPKLSKAGLDALNEYMEQWDVLRARKSSGFYMEDGVLDQSALRADINYLQMLKESLEDVVKLSNTTSNESPDSSLDDQTKQAEEAAEAARKRAEFMEKANQAYQETFADTTPAEVDGSFDKMGASLAEAYENTQKLVDAKREMNNIPDTDDGTGNAQKAADAAREQAEFMEKAAQAYREAFASMDKSVEQNGEGGADFASGYIESLEKLQQKITEVAESVSILDDFFRQLGSSGDTFDGLHKNLTDVGESLTALDSFFREFGETTSGIGAAKEMGEAVQNISIGKNSVENIINLSSAIEMLGESFGKLSSDKFNNEALSSINNLLEKGEQLKDLAKVLEANQNKIREAGKAADTGTAPKESDSEKAAREANEEYNKLIQKFEEAGKAKTKLNQILTKEVAGKTVDAQKAEAEAESQKSDKEAEASLARINEMYRQGAISIGQLLEAREKYNKSIKASAKSEDDLLAAMEKEEQKAKQDARNKEENAKMNDFKAKRDAYNKDLAEYEKLYTRSAIGEGLSAGGNARMGALKNSLGTQYNDLVAGAKNGSASIQNLVKDLRTVDQVSSDLAKSKGTEWLSKLNNQLDNMKKQSSWRPDSWAKGLAEFGNGIKEFQEAIDRGAGYEELKKMYDKLQATQKGLVKDSNFLPMKDNWQSSFSNKVETWANKNKDAAKAFNDELNQIRESIKNVNNEADALQVEDQFNKMSAEAQKQGLSGKSLGDRFKDQFKNTMTSLATYYLSFQDFVRYGREAISMVTELDTALTEMRKVSDESLTNLQDYQIESFDIADRVGTTAVQIQQSTADWLRLGKDLPQASQMAEMSTKLLNVSEFTSVDDATQALVSATQAYTDVTASDIVDKLNLIGNNFAVSTDELAQGLQNAGAVLKTQGNDLDQTLALLTAGNLIGQDMSKASAGVRTISLRIAGTKEAKDELSDMGEDIDDFVVRTQSKTDEIIRAYTAVQKNGYQGVSVLDSNGNLRDTYDILLDIADVYEDIQKEDKQHGTNRAQALIEELAKSLPEYMETYISEYI